MSRHRRHGTHDDSSAFQEWLSRRLGREVIDADEGPARARNLTVYWPESTLDVSLSLAPYADDDLAAIDAAWARQPSGASRFVVLRDDACDTWLLLLCPAPDDATGYRVVFPSAWPVTPQGRGKLHCMNGSADWREVRRIGDAARPHDWILRAVPVQFDSRAHGEVDIEIDVEPTATRPAHGRYGALGLFGAIDVDGRFVIPPRYRWIGDMNGLLGTVQRALCPPLPEGRLSERRWAEVLEPDAPHVDALGREVCDVIEVWSHALVNPPGIRALSGSLEWGMFTVCHDLTVANHVADGRIAPMHAGRGEVPPMRWRSVGRKAVQRVIAVQCDTRGTWGYVDPLGRTVIEPRFAHACSIDAGLAFVELARQGLWGAITFDADEPLRDVMTGADRAATAVVALGGRARLARHRRRIRRPLHRAGPRRPLGHGHAQRRARHAVRRRGRQARRPVPDVEHPQHLPPTLHAPATTALARLADRQRACWRQPGVDGGAPVCVVGNL